MKLSHSPHFLSYGTKLPRKDRDGKLVETECRRIMERHNWPGFSYKEGEVRQINAREKSNVSVRAESHRLCRSSLTVGPKINPRIS